MSETKFVHFAVIDPLNRHEVGPQMEELHVVIYCYFLKPKALIDFFFLHSPEERAKSPCMMFMWHSTEGTHCSEGIVIALQFQVTFWKVHR